MTFDRLRTTTFAVLAGPLAATLVAGCADREEPPAPSGPPPREVINENPSSPSVPPATGTISGEAATRGGSTPAEEAGKAETPGGPGESAPEVIEKPAEPTPGDPEPKAGVQAEDKGSEQP